MCVDIRSEVLANFESIQPEEVIVGVASRHFYAFLIMVRVVCVRPCKELFFGHTPSPSGSQYFKTYTTGLRS